MISSLLIYSEQHFYNVSSNKANKKPRVCNHS